MGLRTIRNEKKVGYSFTMVFVVTVAVLVLMSQQSGSSSSSRYNGCVDASWIPKTYEINPFVLRSLLQVVHSNHHDTMRNDDRNDMNDSDDEKKDWSSKQTELLSWQQFRPILSSIRGGSSGMYHPFIYIYRKRYEFLSFLIIIPPSTRYAPLLYLERKKKEIET